MNEKQLSIQGMAIFNRMWLLELGLHLIGLKAQKVLASIRLYQSCFAFRLHDLEG